MNTTLGSRLESTNILIDSRRLPQSILHRLLWSWMKLENPNLEYMQGNYLEHAYSLPLHVDT